MKQQLEEAISQLILDTFSVEVNVELTRPEPKFGDYATNVALQLAGKLSQNPRQVAEKLSSALSSHDLISQTSVAGPGFINFRLTDKALTGALSSGFSQIYANQTVVAEYSDPNPFKVLHAGHLYTSVVGDAIANLAEAAGAKVHRVNFGGDVGMHVGKTMWAILQELGGENPAGLNDVAKDKRAEWLAAAYVKGNNTYDEDEAAKAEMIELNKKVYQIHADNDHQSSLAQIYWQCRQWSYDYFDAFYERIGSHFEKYYPESETAEIGLKTVREHIGDVFEESDGAVVFAGEKYGLHTRVFINSQGIPTYESKDVGLIMKKWQDYKFDKSIIVTANEQAQYMQVVLKAIEQFAPELANATTHITHGVVKLAGGVKMSSRKGNILRAVDVLDAASQASQTIGKSDDKIILGAVKYAFLKNRIGGDIIYDPAESVAMEGNSGPYLQYANVRARSILRKASEAGASEANISQPAEFEDAERQLLLKLTEFNEVVDKAVVEMMPHHICTYLYELAQTFNRFYENNRVIGDSRQATRLYLVSNYANTLQTGLSLLGMPVPERM